MRDIDFEELDRAVNRFLGIKNPEPEEANLNEVKTENGQVDVKPQADFVSQPPRNASDFHKTASTASRGRFMDIVPASQAVPPVVGDRPLKYTSKAAEKQEEAKPDLPSLKDDFKTESVRLKTKKPADLIDRLETRELATEIDLNEVDYQAPVLESVGGEEFVGENLAKSSQQNEKNQQNDGRQLEVVPREIVRFEREIQPAPARVGVFPIDENKDLMTFGGEDKVEKVLPEIESKFPAPKTSDYDFSEFIKPTSSEVEVREDISLPADNSIELAEKTPIQNQAEMSAKTDMEPIEASKSTSQSKVKVDDQQVNPRVEKEKTLGIDDLTPSNPFLPNARIEKRPLGAPRSGGNLPESIESKIVGQNQAKPQKTTANSDQTPILASDDYITPIKPKKKSGWGAVLAILLIIIACGVGLGLLAFYLTM